MSKQWPTARLGEVLRHRKKFVTIDDVMIYRRPRVQLHAQGIIPRDEVPGALIKTKQQQVCRAGEFLVAEIDAKVGGFGIVPSALDGAIVNSHDFLFEIDPIRLDRRFLDYFIRTPAFRDQVEAQGSTNYAAIQPAHVLGYEIPLPPLAEQRRVVARIAVGATLGIPAIVDTDEPFCFQRHVAILKPDHERIQSRFLWHMLRSRTVFEKAWASTTGSAQPTVPLRAIRELPIPIPPIPEQRRMDALQAEVGALKRLQAETAAELDARLPAILDHAFKGEL
jgi:restriction endonuclease S subunit